MAYFLINEQYSYLKKEYWEREKKHTILPNSLLQSKVFYLTVIQIYIYTIARMAAVTNHPIDCE